MHNRIEFVRKKIHVQNPPLPLQSSSIPTRWLDGTRPNPELEQEGLRLLRENKIAVLMVAGGLSTRIGMNSLRGNIPIGPVTQRSIFRLQGEKIAAIGQRYAPEIPWLVMTSQEVHSATVASFEDEEYFGVPPERIWFFQQSSFPVLDAENNPIVLPDGGYVQSPCGHGGMLEALEAWGILTRLQEEGVEYLFYFQYPNVLENICDPVMLGYHHAGQFDTTTKAVLNCSTDERMGRCVEIDGHLRIVEYHFLNDQLPDALWRTAPASIATHVWSIAFLKRCLKNKVVLPYHVVPHNVPVGAPQPLRKVEQFIFDLLLHSRANGLMIIARKDEYAPVKTVQGIYSIDSAKLALSCLYNNWLLKAGAVLEEGKGECIVEVSPLFALNAKELGSKIPTGFPIHHNMVLSDNT